MTLGVKASAEELVIVFEEVDHSKVEVVVHAAALKRKETEALIVAMSKTTFVRAIASTISQGLIAVADLLTNEVEDEVKTIVSVLMLVAEIAISIVREIQRSMIEASFDQ